MDGKLRVPDAAIIGQDEVTEIHVQAPAQSGRLHVEVRLWRRGPVGFAPFGTGLTLHAPDLDALWEAIAELLEASQGGQQVARVVCDVDQGRRVRAEIEPFGTRFVARLGFWQRVRDTWRPADDGLVVSAERLHGLQSGLERFRSWIHSPAIQTLPPAQAIPEREALLRWPTPGADWLTMEPDRIAFHPKGVRITFTIAEQEADAKEEARHWLAVRQWRREESIWLPEVAQLPLTILDLDMLIPAVRRVADAYHAGNALIPEEVGCQDGSVVRMQVLCSEQLDTLLVEQRPAAREDRVFGFEMRLSVPAEHILRFGRALAQGWSMLLGWLSDEERVELQTREFRERVDEHVTSESTLADPLRPAVPDLPVAVESVSLSEPAAAVEPPSGSDEATQEILLVAPPRSEEPATKGLVPQSNRQLDRMFPFGAESETPGIVVPFERCIRVVVEGYLLARAIELPVDVIPKVITGLEQLNVLRHRQARVDPILLCDRPDCAVYGRVGTVMNPDAVELRVWTGPTTSDSVSFEVIYLDDLLDAMYQSLELMGYPMRSRDRSVVQLSPPPAPVIQAGAPAQVRRIAPAQPLTIPGPIAVIGRGANVSPPHAEVPLSEELGEIRLGHHRVTLKLRGYSHHPCLALEWEGQYFELPAVHLEELLSDLRGLYYDALRGRRGRTLEVGEYPVVTISVRNQGTQLYVWIEQEIDGEVTALTFPAGEVPILLNAASAAFTGHLGRSGTEATSTVAPRREEETPCG
jgi:hypothetical protein